MSNNNASYTQAANVERRTWDKEVWEAKAKARQEQEKSGKSVGPVIPAMKKKKKKRSLEEDDDEDDKEEFQRAAEGAAGPEKSKRAFVKARRNKVADIDSKIGSTEVVSADAVAVTTTNATGDVSDGVTKTGIGWHCRVCDCFLKDSHTYFDHINGRKHQRNLGYSMRVERSTKEQVNERLKKLVAQQQSSRNKEEASLFMGASDMIKKKDEELKRQKEERIKRRKERKEAKKKEEEEAEEADEPQIDPAMAAMMGFSGFGGGNKNR